MRGLSDERGWRGVSSGVAGGQGQRLARAPEPAALHGGALSATVERMGKPNPAWAAPD